VIAAEVRRTRRRSGWAVRRILAALGVPVSSYYRQRHRSPCPTQRHRSPAVHEALPAERAAVMAYARAHPELRHRELAWRMVDEDVACLSPSTVLRILRAAGLVAPWFRPLQRRGRLPARPQAPNQLWQTDLRHVRIRHRNYYLLAFVDVCSRYIPHHALLSAMDGDTLALEAASALGPLPERSRPLIQSDNGSGFISREFAQVLREHAVTHHRIQPHTPEQNAFVERVLRTLGERLDEHELAAIDQARSAIAEIIEWYNHRRLHSAIEFLTPADVHFGRAPQRLAERRRKLAAARHARREHNLNLRQRTLALADRNPTRESYTSRQAELSHFA
jgi:transposase InsO family protein